MCDDLIGACDERGGWETMMMIVAQEIRTPHTMPKFI